MDAVGIAGKVSKEDYMMEHALRSQKVNGSATLLAPKTTEVLPSFDPRLPLAPAFHALRFLRAMQHIGVKPNVPLEEKLMSTYKEQQQAIQEANVVTPLPVPAGPLCPAAPVLGCHWLPRSASRRVLATLLLATRFRSSRRRAICNLIISMQPRWQHMPTYR